MSETIAEKYIKKVVEHVKQTGALPLDYEAAEEKCERTFLSYCVWNNWPEELKILISAGADIKKVKKAINQRCTPLIEAVKLGRVECVKVLAEAGDDLNQTNEDGHSALFLARTALMLQWFHQKGFDLNQRDVRGQTVLTNLMWTRFSKEDEKSRSFEICKLIDMGIVDINWPARLKDDEHGYVERTPLMTSLLVGVSVTQKLIETGADLYYITPDKITVFDLVEGATRAISTEPKLSHYNYLHAIDEKNKLNQTLSISDKKDLKSNKI